MGLNRIGTRVEAEKPAPNVIFLENKFKTFEKRDVNKVAQWDKSFASGMDSRQNSTSKFF
jgi:hypothetical protein